MRVDPKKQFSKWLARFGAIIWGVYVFAMIPLIAYRPEAAMACVWLTLIMTCNKALDTVQYTRNSTTEKIILGVLEKLQLEIGLKGIGKSIAGSAAKSEPQEDSGDDETSGEDGTENG